MDKNKTEGKSYLSCLQFKKVEGDTTYRYNQRCIWPPIKISKKTATLNITDGSTGCVARKTR